MGDGRWVIGDLSPNNVVAGDRRSSINDQRSVQWLVTVTHRNVV